jgi:hypothetical protein
VPDEPAQATPSDAYRLSVETHQGVRARALHNALISTLLDKGVLTPDDVAAIEAKATEGVEKITHEINEDTAG